MKVAHDCGFRDHLDTADFTTSALCLACEIRGLREKLETCKGALRNILGAYRESPNELAYVSSRRALSEIGELIP